MENSVQLTPRFTLAVDYARQIHVSLRKGTQLPYMAHLLGVASLVLGETGHVPFPVTEDMAIAALLHDARAILKEYKQIGSEVWSRFKRGRKQQLWYFDELIKVYEERSRPGR